jgi:GntR family transcriptional regulator
MEGMEDLGNLSREIGPDDEVDPLSLDEVWKQTAAILLARIRAGRYQPGRPIPSIKYLHEELGGSRGTVSRASDWLKAQGLVRSVYGRGVFVLPEHMRPKNKEEGH